MSARNIAIGIECRPAMLTCPTGEKQDEDEDEEEEEEEERAVGGYSGKKAARSWGEEAVLDGRKRMPCAKQVTVDYYN